MTSQALSLLKKAKISPRLERQEILVSKAMNLLGDNCEERHIDAIIAALADLQRHYVRDPVNKEIEYRMMV